MLFSLALGALIVGLDFRKQVPDLAKRATTYDLILISPQKIKNSDISQIKPNSIINYPYKTNNKRVYYRDLDFARHPLTTTNFINDTNKVKQVKLYDKQIKSDHVAKMQLAQLGAPQNQTKDIVLVSETMFNKLNSKTNYLTTIKVENFMQVFPQIKQLVKRNEKLNLIKKRDKNLKQRVNAYDFYNSGLSGFQFMGFFLGIAFLTMLASCLMFKILSGASVDKKRYEMLYRIGASPAIIKKSLRRELTVFFMLPAGLGLIHVLCGLQMFKLFFSNPYANFWLPTILFLFLYLLYLELTLFLYKKIILQK